MYILIFSALLPSKLRVNPSVITETDSVTLDCQTPSVSVSQCYFYALSRVSIREFSCVKTLTGMELLEMSSQNAPAEVKVRCYYIVKLGEKDSPSPHSDAASISITSEYKQLQWITLRTSFYSMIRNNKVAQH